MPARVDIKTIMAFLVGLALTAAGFLLLNKMVRDSIRRSAGSMKGGRDSADRVIELQDYEILDDQSGDSEGRRVKVS